MLNIALFASGSGSNAENIINFFHKKKDVNISVVVSNNKNAYVHTRAKYLGVHSVSFKKEEFENGRVLDFLKENKIDFVVLSGFLLKVPSPIITAFPRKIINIHPALLPKFGGKGMYGDHVHKAVVEAGEKESGITIHFVNDRYDEGEIIFQAKCKILPTDSYIEVANKVHALEYKYFPSVIDKVVSGLKP